MATKKPLTIYDGLVKQLQAGDTLEGAGGGGTTYPQGTCDFRLGLQEDIPVSTADQTGKTILYVNPFERGNRLGLFNGTSWTLFQAPKFAVPADNVSDATNYDIFGFYSTPTHSSTNTSTDVVTWTANPGWVTGTYVYVATTGGGLTAGTNYWYSRASSTTGAFHTTLAGAIAGTGKVDLTGNVTQTLIGITADAGPGWSNSGAGTSSRGAGAGTTEHAIQDGALVNAVSLTTRSGGYTLAAKNGLYLGSIRPFGSNNLEDSGVALVTSNKRFVYSHYNRVPRVIAFHDNSTHSPMPTVLRQWNGVTSQCQVLIGDAQHINAGIAGDCSSNGTNLAIVGVSVNSIVGLGYPSYVHGGAGRLRGGKMYPVSFPAGYNFVSVQELADPGNTGTTAFACWLGLIYMG